MHLVLYIDPFDVSKRRDDLANVVLDEGDEMYDSHH